MSGHRQPDSSMEQNQETFLTSTDDPPMYSDSSDALDYEGLRSNPYEAYDKFQLGFYSPSRDSLLNIQHTGFWSLDPSDDTNEIVWASNRLKRAFFSDFLGGDCAGDKELLFGGDSFGRPQHDGQFPPLDASSSQVLDQSLLETSLKVNKSRPTPTTDPPLPSGSASSASAVTAGLVNQTTRSPPFPRTPKSRIISPKGLMIATWDLIGNQQGTPDSPAIGTPTQPLVPLASKVPKNEYNCTQYLTAASTVCVKIIFKNRREFEIHLREVHGIEKYLECPNFAKCGYKCSRYDNLQVHRRGCGVKIKPGAKKRTPSVLTPNMPDNSRRLALKRQKRARSVKALFTAPPTPIAKSPALCTSSQEIDAANNIMELDGLTPFRIENPSPLEQSFVANPELLEGPMSSKANDIADDSNGQGGQPDDQEAHIARLMKELSDAKLKSSQLEKEVAELKNKLKDAEFDSELWRNKAREQNRNCSCVK
ncbi:hypothetical protein TWF106_004847 [Orbilia oligospora]|uniref:C2H2-type domain-containing protein n=1 Tax=Orbilia oligospora TaxID=2813651 RepID=A0A7C8UZ29_ORBOL|nr:hypothetical protein TWF106_004847 [Orbilia oligospora]